MNDTEQSILLARLDERYKAIDEKLDHIMEKQDKTNGRVLASEGKIQTLERWQSESKGERKATVIIGGAISAIVGFLIAWFRQN